MLHHIRVDILCSKLSALVSDSLGCQLLTLGTNDPCNAPSGKSEALGETVNDQDIILIDILNVLSSRDGGTVAVAGVVVARVELVADEGGTTTADVLDLGQLRVGDNTTSGVSGVGSEDDRGTTGNFLGNLVGVDVISILFRERDGNGRELWYLISLLAARTSNTSQLSLKPTFLKRLNISL